MRMIRLENSRQLCENSFKSLKLFKLKKNSISVVFVFLFLFSINAQIKFVYSQQQNNNVVNSDLNASGTVADSVLSKETNQINTKIDIKENKSENESKLDNLTDKQQNEINILNKNKDYSTKLDKLEQREIDSTNLNQENKSDENKLSNQTVSTSSESSFNKTQDVEKDNKLPAEKNDLNQQSSRSDSQSSSQNNITEKNEAIKETEEPETETITVESLKTFVETNELKEKKIEAVEEIEKLEINQELTTPIISEQTNAQIIIKDQEDSRTEQRTIEIKVEETNFDNIKPESIGDKTKLEEITSVNSQQELVTNEIKLDETTEKTEEDSFNTSTLTTETLVLDQKHSENNPEISTLNINKKESITESEKEEPKLEFETQSEAPSKLNHIESFSRRINDKLKNLRTQTTTPNIDNDRTHDQTHVEHDHTHEHHEHDHTHEHHEHDHTHEHHEHDHDHDNDDHTHEHVHHENINKDLYTTSTVTQSQAISFDKNKNESGNLIKEATQEIRTNNKFCADIDQIKHIFNEHIEPYYLPLLSMLPDDLQIMLNKETFAGLSTANYLFIIMNMSFIFTFFLLISKLIEGKKLNVNSSLNEQLIIATNKLKKLEFDNKTFMNTISDLEERLRQSETTLGEREDKLKETFKTNSQLTHFNEQNSKEINKLKSNEAKMIKDLNQTRIEFNNLNELYTNQKQEFDSKLEDLSQRLSQKIEETENYLTKLQQYELITNNQTEEIQNLKNFESELRAEIDAKENTIQVLKNSLSLVKPVSNQREVDSDENSDDFVRVSESAANEDNLENLMRLGQLKIELQTLQSKFDESVLLNESKLKDYDQLNESLTQKEEECKQLSSKLSKLEKQIKENEMQIKLLNELREKDTKQHLKALSEMDMQLKKKTTDAEKVNHYLDQLRVKQERIQELESSLNRVEKQSNQERQTFEKQAHENWLNSKKIDKELKEAKTELLFLKEKLSEFELINKNLSEEINLLKQQNFTTNIINNDNLDEIPRPSSASSNSANMPPTSFIPPSLPFIRPPPYRFPFPVPPINPAAAAVFMQQQLEQQRLNSASPNFQDQSKQMTMPPPNHPMYRIFMQQHQQQQHNLYSNSAASSQQPSPGTNYPLASTTLNDQSYSNINQINQQEEQYNQNDYGTNNVIEDDRGSNFNV